MNCLLQNAKVDEPESNTILVPSRESGCVDLLIQHGWEILSFSGGFNGKIIYLLAACSSHV
jgi:hypothetical protein